MQAWLLPGLQAAYFNPGPPQWGKNNAIVMFGAGAVKIPELHQVKSNVFGYARMVEAMQLYLACKKAAAQCTLIISGGDPLATGKPEALVYQEVFRDLGIEQADILLDQRSQNTFENAKFTSFILKSRNYDKIFLVTSAYHMKRALLYSSHFGIHATPEIADYSISNISFSPKGYNLALADFAMHEYVGILRFYVYNFFGWNK